MESLLFKPPLIDVSHSIEDILELYSFNTEMESVIITEGGKYLGILDSSAILRILSEKQILIAQDQNPLSKLPGNFSINNYLSEIINHEGENGKICVYFDFNHFKPFNDTYGFRQGDRIIRLFSDILKENTEIPKEFIGHIGGDDFLIGFCLDRYTSEDILEEVKTIVERFKQDVIPFYNEIDKKNGFLFSKNRSGRMTKFSLLTVSAAVLHFKDFPKDLTTEIISGEIALLKKKSKKAAGNMAFKSFSL